VGLTLMLVVNSQVLSIHAWHGVPGIGYLKHYHACCRHLLWDGWKTSNPRGCTCATHMTYYAMFM